MMHITIKHGMYRVFTSKETSKDCMPIQIFYTMGELKAWLNRQWLAEQVKVDNNLYDWAYNLNN